MSPIAVLQELLALGGPVVGILIIMSVITLATTLYKLWQFATCGVGRHKVLAPLGHILRPR